MYEPVAQMIAVLEQPRRPGPVAEQKRENRRVLLGRVAQLARQHEIVPPIVGVLPAPRRDMIERHRPRTAFLPTVRTDRPVLCKQPRPGLEVRPSPGRLRRQMTGATR